MFTGFRIEYPTYDIICPQTGFTFSLRGLNVSETDKLKTSLSIPSKATSVLNRVIWDSITEKPSIIKTFEDFKKYVTLRDREALLYGLYYTTFGTDRDYNMTCRNCGDNKPIKIKIDNIFSFNAYPGSESIMNSYKVAKSTNEAEYDGEIENNISENEPIELPEDNTLPNGIKFVEDEEDGILTENDIKQNKTRKPSIQKSKKEKIELSKTSILSKLYKLELPTSKVIAILKQPTILDEETVLNNVPFAKNKQIGILSETLVIDKFEVYDKGSKIPTQVVDKRDDILFGYQSLPVSDKIEIFKAFDKEFGEYGIDLKGVYACSRCSFDNDYRIDITEQFFRMVATS